MLEPRRIAAVSAARWMAQTLGEQVGGTIGYAIRFDTKSSAKTRIEVVTEGILTRRIQSDPGLDRRVPWSSSTSSMSGASMPTWRWRSASMSGTACGRT